MRIERDIKVNKLVIDTDSTVSYSIKKGASNSEFIIQLNNTRLGYDIRKINLRNSFLRDMSAKRDPATNQLNIRVSTTRDVAAKGVVLVMPKGQGERLVVEFFTLQKERQSAGNINEIGIFAIELERSGRLYSGNLMSNPIVENFHVYSVTLSQTGSRRFSLRVGFFDSVRKAEQLRDQLKILFPTAEIISVSSKERDNFVDETKVASARRDKQLREDVNTQLELERQRQKIESPDGGNAFDRMLEEARQAMANEQFRKAIAIYGRLINEAPAPMNQLAQEYIGVARQLNGQLSHAVAEYKKYLAMYPGTEGAERIEQRLASINSQDDDWVVLKQSERGNPRLQQQLNTYGSVLVNYRSASIGYGNGESVNALSTLDTYADAVTKYRGAEYDADFRFSGGYSISLLEDDPSFSRISYLYANLSSRESGHTLKLGRQRGKKGGVLGRYDGMEGGYAVNDWVKVNATFGFPVDRSSDGLNASRFFFGSNVDLLNVFDTDFNVFFLQQMFEGEVDRQAIGGEARYSGDHSSAYSYFDYDVKFAALNAFLFNYNYLTDTRIHYNVNYSARKSPYLSLRNALLGRSLDEYEDLVAELPEGETLEDIALDKTYDSEVLTLNINLPLSQKYAFNTTFSASYLSNNNERNTSADAAQFVISENEYRTSFQLVTQNFMMKDFTLISGYELICLEQSTINSLTLNSLYQLSANWRLRPGLSANWRSFDNGDFKSSYHPRFKMEYRLYQSLSMEFDWDWYFYNDTYSESVTYTEETVENTDVMYIRAGFRYTF